MPQAYTSGYRALPFTDFSGGINLRDKADAIGDKEAIDLLNVTFTERGAIRQRDGYTDLTQQDLVQRVDSLSSFYTAGGLHQLIAGCGTRLEALDPTGNVIASLTGLGGGPWSFARTAQVAGAPTSEYLYCANGIDTLRRWNGVSWAAPLGTVNGVSGALPRPGSITLGPAAPGSSATSNANNRLVATAFGTQTAAGPGGAETNPSRVWFSNANSPETWETAWDNTAQRGANFIDLTPGDGERIMAAVTWRELIFVFKETKFFVFWGESINPKDQFSPVFNYREVINDIGLRSPLAVAVGRDGVYFLNRRGVYRTTGGDPVLLSDNLAPLWTGDPDVYYRGDPINVGQLGLARMCWFMEQLFVAVPTGDRLFNDRLLLYDTRHSWWTIYDIAASALANFRRQDRGELHHGYATGPLRVGRRNYGSSHDRGDQAITSRWRSGWSDYSDPNQKTVRETKVWGSGAVTVSFSVDFNRGQQANLAALYGTATNWPVTTGAPTYGAVRATYPDYQAVLDGNLDYADLRS